MPRRSAKDPTVSPIEDTIDHLYSLNPDEFTKERNEAAKRLHDEGDRAGSDSIKGLRRPTVAAWAVNQLPRRRPDLVDELLEAGAALRAAQRAALSASGKVDLRDVTLRRRAAVAELLEEATALFHESGRDAAPHTDAIRSTLEAASADESAGDLVRSGRLTKEVEPPSGLGDITPFQVLPGGRAAAGGKQAVRGKAPPEETAATRRLRERMEARVAKKEETLAAAREAAAESRREAAAAQKEVDRLEGELRTASRRAERASKAASVAQGRAEEAERARARAQAELEADT